MISWDEWKGKSSRQLLRKTGRVRHKARWMFPCIIARQHITRFIVRSQQFVDLTAQFEVSGANPGQMGRALLSGELEGLGENRYLTIGRIVHHNTRKCAPSW